MACKVREHDLRVAERDEARAERDALDVRLGLYRALELPDDEEELSLAERMKAAEDASGAYLEDAKRAEAERDALRARCERLEAVIAAARIVADDAYAELSPLREALRNLDSTEDR